MKTHTNHFKQLCLRYLIESEKKQIAIFSIFFVQAFLEVFAYHEDGVAGRVFFFVFAIACAFYAGNIMYSKNKTAQRFFDISLPARHGQKFWVSLIYSQCVIPIALIIASAFGVFVAEWLFAAVSGNAVSFDFYAAFWQKNRQFLLLYLSLLLLTQSFASFLSYCFRPSDTSDKVMMILIIVVSFFLTFYFKLFNGDCSNDIMMTIKWSSVSIFILLSFVFWSLSYFKLKKMEF